MAAIALINLILVLFDLSYIRFRDQYLRVLPEPTIWYGERFKGIEPERTTVGYLALVDELTAQLNEPALDQQTRARILAQLTEQSAIIVDENPFEVAGKSGTLERIKNILRDRQDEESSKAAFREFWDLDNFTDAQQGQATLDFFDREIRPLMNTNYFRGIDESGGPIDLFWQIDLPFMLLFAAEFLARTFVLSRRHRGTSWPDAMLWRIYDVPLFIGFWRWVRVVPVTLRLHQACWINLEPARNRISRALVSQFAVELTEIVLVRVIDQLQSFIREGDIARLIASATDRRQYIDINGIDEVQTIAKRLSDVVVYQVLPTIKPEIDALLQRSVVGALNQAPAYQGLKLMPGFETLSTLNQTLQNVFADEESARLTSQLISRFGESLALEVQKEETLSEVRLLVNDLLEEIKINYVDGVASEDVEALQESRYRLYGITGR